MVVHGNVLSVEDIENQIRTKLGQRIRGLAVTVREHGLVLQGRTPDYYSKQLAQQAAMELGIAVLSNDIQVN